MNLLLNFDLLSVGIAVASTVILGFIVYFSNKKSITNQTFLYFTLAAIFWGATNYLSYQISSTEVIFWIRFEIFFAVWYSFFLFQFFYVFPQEKIVFPKWYKFFLVPLAVSISIFNLTPFVYKGIAELAPTGQASVPIVAPGIYLFAAVVVGLIMGAIFFLIKKMRKIDKAEKLQYRLIAFGAFFTFALHIIFNLILPGMFLYVRFVPLGALFTFPFVLFTSYAILRHKLFNIRAAGAAVLIFFLSIMSFIDIVQTSDVAQIFLRSLTLVMVLAFGIMLIKNIVKEVEQKEKMEKMAEEIKKAYEVEKKANEELDTLDKVKNQFLMQTQHDLRTPLSTIRGYCELLITGTLGKQSKKTLDAVKRIYVVAGDKIRDVNNFLDITQFQLGKKVVALRPGVELSPILEEIFNQLEHEAKAKNIYLKLEKDNEKIFIEADPEKLKSALFNVIDNSIKYTQNGGVAVIINLQQPKVIISIKDTGIGIPKEKIKTLFDTAFERGEQAKKTFATGRGIGLYLSSQIIKAHNGKIWAESEGEGKGTTFFIELPVNSADY